MAALAEEILRNRSRAFRLVSQISVASLLVLQRDDLRRRIDYGELVMMHPSNLVISLHARISLKSIRPPIRQSPNFQSEGLVNTTCRSDPSDKSILFYVFQFESTHAGSSSSKIFDIEYVSAA